MFPRTIFVYFVGFILVNLVKTDSLNIAEITFKMHFEKDQKNHLSQLICDHNYDTKQETKYTVLEGEKFKIKLEHNTIINKVICRNYYSGTTQWDSNEINYFKNVTTFVAEKDMGNLWNCTVLTNRDGPLKPVVRYLDKGKNHTFSAGYCYMQIHVRQKTPPQTIFVNNMALQAVRTDLSEKDVDFTAEYQYLDGDVVKVACVNFLGTGSLRMEYPMADMLSDKFTSRSLSSNKAIGFATILHSAHNNSHMICTASETSDYTKVMVRFVMQSKSNIVSIKINGMTLRPKLFSELNNMYLIEYKYESNRPIKVVCEVKQTDKNLVVTDSTDFAGAVKSYKKRVLIPSKKAEMSFHPNAENIRLSCSADDDTGSSVEWIEIKFSEGNLRVPLDPYPLHMELPPNGTVLELYDYGDDKSRNVIFYEFEEDEKLQLKCGPLHVLPQPAPVLSLNIKNLQCLNNGCYVTQNLTVTDQHDNSELVCYLNEMIPDETDRVVKEIRVIFRKRVPTTTTITTTTTTITPITTMVQPTDREATNNDILIYILPSVLGVVAVCTILVIIKIIKNKRSSIQQLPPPPQIPVPAMGYYENLLSVFAPINEREADAMENHYEKIE